MCGIGDLNVLNELSVGEVAICSLAVCWFNGRFQILSERMKYCFGNFGIVPNRN